MSSSLLLQQWPACPVRLTLIVFVTGGKWPYNCCFVGRSLHDLSVLLTGFLGSCRLAFSPYVLLAPMKCIHIAVSTRPLLGRNCVLFYRSRLTSICAIVYRYLSMPLLVACWCLSRLMRHCFLGRWTCPLVSESYRFVWRCHLFD